MKACVYCGQEQIEEAVHCSGCGTEFTNQTVKAEKVERSPRDWRALKALLAYAAACGLGIVIYLLSFGPILSYCRHTYSSAAPGITVTTTRAIRCPSWVGVVYAPAILLMSSPIGGDYCRYLDWCQYHSNAPRRRSRGILPPPAPHGK